MDHLIVSTTHRPGNSLARSARITALLSLLIAPAAVHAQEIRLEVKGLGGFGMLSNGPDEPGGRALAGGAVRFFVAEDLAIEPEFLYLAQSGDAADFMVGAALQYGGSKGYFLVSAGAYNERTRITDEGSGSTQLISEWKPSILGGFAGHFHVWEESSGDGRSRAVVLTPEARFGYNPLFRITLAIGYEWY